MIEASEEAVAHGRNITRVEAVCGQTRQGAIIVEGVEEVVSHCCDITRVKTSFWETRQGAIIVEGVEKKISHTRRTISKERQVWHITHIYITRRCPCLWHEWLEITRKRPPTRPI